MMCGRPSFFFVEVYGEGVFERFAVPGIGFEELFVGFAFFVPVRKQ